MDNNKITKYLILVFGYLAVLYPPWVRIGSLQWGFNSSLIPNLFPLFGLTAFSLLWLHSISGVFEPWLKKYINFDKYVHDTSILILICIIAHPLLLLLSLGFNTSSIYAIYGVKYIWFAIIGWCLLITYDVGKALKKYNFFVKHWNAILTISTIGFLLTFFHSLNLGSDLQSGLLRIVWIFYGTTAILSTIYTYGIKRFLKL
ncbi:MAG: hypothetical protein EXS52_00980 [Candidatus Staskawiczbacteria bacterium]|nr:hypothetical protein [Candidatus Staskawiczbacteria bacterium]